MSSVNIPEALMRRLDALHLYTRGHTVFDDKHALVASFEDLEDLKGMVKDFERLQEREREFRAGRKMPR